MFWFCWITTYIPIHLDQISNCRSGGEKFANDIQFLASKDAHSQHKSYWFCSHLYVQIRVPYCLQSLTFYITFDVTDRAARSLRASIVQNSHLLGFFSRSNAACSLCVKAEAQRHWTGEHRRLQETPEIENASYSYC